MRTSSRDAQVILLLHIVTIISIVLNVPFIRQVFCFFYLAFIPGYLILKILKLDDRDSIVTILLSVGLSIAFLMFTGLVINEFYPLFGVSKPLSAVPITATLMSLTTVLLLTGYRRNLQIAVSAGSLPHITWKSLFKVSLLVLPPALGVIGALYNYTGALLLMIFLVAMLWALAVFSGKFLPDELRPLAITAIGLALLLHTTLISPYNLGNDVNSEYYTYKMTEIQGYWRKPGIVTSESQIANYQSDLSITILPTICSVVMNLSGELIFKLFFAFLLSLLPLAIYRVCEPQTGKMYALLAAFLFMSMRYSFYGTEPLAVGRQIVAELFFMLSVLLIVDKKMELRTRKILFIVFGVALVVSHYSIAYIYLFYVILTFILTYRRQYKEILGPMAVLFLCTCVFSWYVFVSDSPTLGLARRIESMYTSFLTDLFNPAARSSAVFSYLDPSTSTSIVGLIHRYFVYLQSFFIVVGIAISIVRRNEMSFTREYQRMSTLAALILVASFALPRLAPALNLTRFYGITLLLLAPFFALGGVTFFESMKKVGALPFAKFKTSADRGQKLWSSENLSVKIVAVILIVTFLFQVGFVNHVTGGDSLSISLDLDRRKATTDPRLKTSFYEVYIPEQDVFGARWYATNINLGSQGYADSISEENVLTAYALADRESIRMISNNTALQHGAYIYLRLLNANDNIVVTETGPISTSNILYLFTESNKMYSNGASEIYYTP